MQGGRKSRLGQVNFQADDDDAREEKEGVEKRGEVGVGVMDRNRQLGIKRDSSQRGKGFLALDDSSHLTEVSFSRYNRKKAPPNCAKKRKVLVWVPLELLVSNAHNNKRKKRMI
jgi:hypothetical protein